MPTAASAGWLSALIRYRLMCRVVDPGPTNQKSEPGKPQRAVGWPPGPSCSTSSPWALAPAALTISPPLADPVGTAPPASLAVTTRFFGTAALAGTCSTVSWPARGLTWLTVLAVVGLSRVSVTLPAPVVVGRLASATPPPVTPAEPGAGQPSSPAPTGSLLTSWLGGAALSLIGRLTPTSAYSAPSTTTTSAARMIRFATTRLLA